HLSLPPLPLISLLDSPQAMREDAGVLLEELDAAIEDEVEEAIEEMGSLVRVKQFAMKPMTVEDAIMEMELLDHDFFLFHNTETNKYSVVYRRADGDYGMIEPDAA
ncbi:MAG: hypothetical protein F4Y44_03045, partial [Chloroflexi bacterium]|nr:hypothetical protein [Chloroflexota bacterium]